MGGGGGPPRGGPQSKAPRHKAGIRCLYPRDGLVSRYVYAARRSNTVRIVVTAASVQRDTGACATPFGLASASNCEDHGRGVCRQFYFRREFARAVRGCDLFVATSGYFGGGIDLLGLCRE